MSRGPSHLDWKEILVTSLVYILATVVLSYPLAFQPASLSRLDNADAQLNAWAVSWVCHQLSENPLALFDANTFYPLPNTLAFSEHLFLPGLLAMPILWLSNDLVLTFNLLLLFGMFISALGMYVLVRTLTHHQGAALLCGLFFSFATFRFVRLPHLQMQWYGFLPLALACLHRFFSEGRKRWAWGLAAFFLLQALSGTYLAAITSVALGVALAVFIVQGIRRLELAQWASLILAFATVAAVLYPFVRPYLWVNRTLGVQWDLEGIGSLSATPMSYLASASRLYRSLLGTVLPEEQVTDFLFPGITLLVLGGVGIWVLATGRAGAPGPRATLVCYLGILLGWFSGVAGASRPPVSLSVRTYRFLSRTQGSDSIWSIAALVVDGSFRFCPELVAR